MNHKVKSHRDSFDLIVSKLAKRELFTFTRFGDGDYMIMYPQNVGQTVGWNNRFVVTEALQYELRECHNIKDKNFLIGTMLNIKENYWIKPRVGSVDQGKLNLDEHDELLPMFCLQEMLIKDPDKFVEFPREMRRTNTMLVGGYYHEHLERIYGKIDVFVQTPQVNSYATIDKWYPEVLNNVHKVSKIVLMTGFSSRVIAKRLWGMAVTVIDVGSLSDMFVLDTGLKITGRRYIRENRDRVSKKANHVLQLTRHWNKG